MNRHQRRTWTPIASPADAKTLEILMFLSNEFRQEGTDGPGEAVERTG